MTLAELADCIPGNARRMTIPAHWSHESIGAIMMFFVLRTYASDKVRYLDQVTPLTVTFSGPDLRKTTNPQMGIWAFPPYPCVMDHTTFRPGCNTYQTFLTDIIVTTNVRSPDAVPLLTHMDIIRQHRMSEKRMPPGVTVLRTTISSIERSSPVSLFGRSEVQHEASSPSNKATQSGSIHRANHVVNEPIHISRECQDIVYPFLYVAIEKDGDDYLRPTSLTIKMRNYNPFSEDGSCNCPYRCIQPTSLTEQQRRASISCSYARLPTSMTKWSGTSLAPASAMRRFACATGLRICTMSSVEESCGTGDRLRISIIMRADGIGTRVSSHSRPARTTCTCGRFPLFPMPEDN